MTAPGNIDEAGWRVPKKPLSKKVYYLAKGGFRAAEIARIIGSTPGSVRVLLHHIRHPRWTCFGWRWREDPKTPRKLVKVAGWKHVQEG